MKYIFNSLMLVLVTSSCFAGQLKDEYDLKKRCSEEASEYFQGEGGGIQIGEGHKSLNGYVNHYNKKLNTCMILLSSTTIYDDKSIKKIKMSQLIDLHENSSIGSYIEHESIIECEVAGVSCKSKKSFDKLVKPYMTQ